MTNDAMKELDAMKAAFTALEPLTSEGRANSLQWLATALGVHGSSVTASPSTTVARTNGEGEESDVRNLTSLSPKQFIAKKKPVTDVERVACLAYYLTYGRDTLHFKTEDLTTLNTEAAGLRFGNASQAAANAMNQNGYLAQAGGGRKQLTPRGEALVNALPDREAVAAALAEHPKKGRRPARKRKMKRTA